MADLGSILEMSMYGDGKAEALSVLARVIFFLSIAGGIVLYFTFLSKKNRGKFTGFLGWLYDVLSFNKILIEMLLKILYIVLTATCTLLGFIMLFFGNGYTQMGLFLILFGTIILRVLYESMMLIIILSQNSSEINTKLTHLLPEDAKEKIKTEAAKEEAPAASGFCTKCGTKIPDDSLFCPNCGNKK